MSWDETRRDEKRKGGQEEEKKALSSFFSFFSLIFLLPKVPESLGVVPGIVTAVCIILFHPFFPGLQLFDAATTAITLTVLTGFLDDVPQFL